MNFIRNISIRLNNLSIAFVEIAGFLSYSSLNYFATLENSNRLSAVRLLNYPILTRVDSNKVKIDEIQDVWLTDVTTEIDTGFTTYHISSAFQD